MFIYFADKPDMSILSNPTPQRRRRQANGNRRMRRAGRKQTMKYIIQKLITQLEYKYLQFC